jgi:hypothetical protein
MTDRISDTRNVNFGGIHDASLSLFLFIHVVSAMGVFGAFAIEGLLPVRLRRAASMTEMGEGLQSFRERGPKRWPRT